MDVFDVIDPRGVPVPIILSSPHSGTQFPDEVSLQLKRGFKETPSDADLYIDQLYDFAPELGITMIKANLNRWVVDLNRDPSSKPLYDDGRIITGIVPFTTFNGKQLYRETDPIEEEVQRRIKAYYEPYHTKLSELIKMNHSKFGKVLLFDAHSIRKSVEGIQSQPFPDLILGDNEGTTAGESLINSALKTLKTSDYEVAHNQPFKGGYITRHYGDPANNIHALQLEMAKIIYMDDAELNYQEDRAANVRELLISMFRALISTIGEINV